MRVVSETDAIESFPSLLREAKEHSVIVRDGDSDLGAIISMEDYEVVHRAKVDRLMKALHNWGRSFELPPQKRASL